MSDLNKLKELAKFSDGTPIVFSDKDVNDAQLKEKCLKAIESLRPCHGLAERLGEACFMIALSEIENGWQLRAKAAEAELARRDAEAGERVGVVEVWPGTRSCDFLLSRPLPVGQHNVYTAAQPSALPSEMFMSDAVKANVTTDFMDGANWMRERAKALGCKAIKFGPSLNPEMFNSDVMFGYLKARKECAEMIRHQGFTVEGE